MSLFSWVYLICWKYACMLLWTCSFVLNCCMYCYFALLFFCQSMFAIDMLPCLFMSHMLTSSAHITNKPCIHTSIHTYVRTYIHTYIHIPLAKPRCLIVLYPMILWVTCSPSLTLDKKKSAIHTYIYTYIHTYRYKQKSSFLSCRISLYVRCRFKQLFWYFRVS